MYMIAFYSVTIIGGILAFVIIKVCDFGNIPFLIGYGLAAYVFITFYCCALLFQYGVYCSEEKKKKEAKSHNNSKNTNT